MKRSAFTIIELMMVIAIISVLITIVSIIAKGAIKDARKQRRAAIIRVVQEGVNVYHAQKGEWPIAGLDRKSQQDNEEYYVLNESEVRQAMQKILDECKNGNPMFDVSGLFVSRDGKYGLDFFAAIRGTRKTSRKMKVSEMQFGYPDANGRFESLKMKYVAASDQLLVY